MDEKTWIIAPDGEPRPGFYKTRLVRGGPLVAVTLTEIAPDKDDDGEWAWDFHYRLVIDGEPRDWWETSSLAGEPCTEAEVAYIEAVRQHDRTHGTPLAHARQKIDALQSPLPF